MTLDKRAVKILLDMFWTSAGWRSGPEVSPEDYAYAKSKGVMFEPLSLTHDQQVKWAIEARDSVSQSKVTSAFIASLSTRRLDLRSALGSYAVARHLAEHELVYYPASEMCSICGLYDSSTIDLDVLNFERIKWGGVRHDQPSYIGFDLSRLCEMEPVEPTDEDRVILQAILDTARSMPSTARLSDLIKALAKIVPSNSNERRVLIEILGYCGILVDRSKPDFRKSFVASVKRVRTSHAKDDWPYPVQWWNGSFGVTEDAVDDWFPV